MTDRNRILQKTAGGLDVFVHYLGEGCKNRLFRNPFREDGHPSCCLRQRTSSDGSVRYVMKDYGDSSWYGDCFWLVARLSNLDSGTDFREVLRIIDSELNLFVLDDRSSVEHTMLQKVQPSDTLVSSGGMLTARTVYQRMMKAEQSFWSAYGIGQDTLERFGVRCVATCRLTRPDGTGFTVRSRAGHPVFSYTFEGYDGQKLYMPGSNLRFLYAGHLPHPYVFGLRQLPETADTVFITGGEKDVMSLSAHGFPAVCLNSETARIPGALLDALAGRFKEAVILYDTDDTGRRESALRVAEHRGPLSLYRLDLPLAGTKAEKDVSDFFRGGRDAAALAALVAGIPRP